MNNYQFDGWKRISKTKARKLFDECKTIIATPCKMRFGTEWNSGFMMKKDRYKEGFDQLVNMFEFYNCNNETGKYSAFYANINE